ncbi:hypothetical protein D1872_255560 [compost metagenome]
METVCVLESHETLAPSALEMVLIGTNTRPSTFFGATSVAMFSPFTTILILPDPKAYAPPSTNEILRATAEIDKIFLFFTNNTS